MGVWIDVLRVGSFPRSGKLLLLKIYSSNPGAAGLEGGVAEALHVVVMAQFLADELAQDAVARWGIQKRQNIDQNSKKNGVLVKVLFPLYGEKGLKLQAADGHHENAVGAAVGILPYGREHHSETGFRHARGVEFFRQRV